MICCIFVAVKKWAVILLFSFSAPLLLQLQLLVKYGLEYKIYSEILCENKEKPEMKCNGLCHLSKELSQLDTQNPSEPQIPQVVELELFPFTLTQQKVALKSFLQTHKHQTPYLFQLPEYIPVKDVPPPQLFVA